MAAAKSVKTFTVEFVKDRETKGTFRYAEEVPDGAGEAKIGSLYVRRFALSDLGMPEKITVTVSA